MSELTDRIRARQAGAVKLTNEQIIEAIDRPIREHGEHPWEQIGRCVYCGPCQVRLYQGRIPEGHPVAPRRPPGPTEADRMRERWDKP